MRKDDGFMLLLFMVLALSMGIVLGWYLTVAKYEVDQDLMDLQKQRNDYREYQRKMKEADRAKEYYRSKYGEVLSFDPTKHKPAVTP